MKTHIDSRFGITYEVHVSYFFTSIGHIKIEKIFNECKFYIQDIDVGFILSIYIFISGSSCKYWFQSILHDTEPDKSIKH